MGSGIRKISVQTRAPPGAAHSRKMSSCQEVQFPNPQNCKNNTFLYKDLASVACGNNHEAICLVCGTGKSLISGDYCHCD